MAQYYAFLVLVLFVKLIQAAPLDNSVDSGHYTPDQNYQPMPYDFSYVVDDPPSKNYFGHEEKGGDANGRTDGKYFVLFPDGRLMTVTYFVDAKSGFVPKITFSTPNSNNNVNRGSITAQ